jgi:hypothetical protein
MQCYAAGAAVWFEPSLIVEHHESLVNRDLIRRHHLTARNELWSVWLRCPWPWVLLVSIYRVIRQFLYASSQGARWMIREPVWWAEAAKGMKLCFEERGSASWGVYYQWMRLARNPIYSATELRRVFGRCERIRDERGV